MRHHGLRPWDACQEDSVSRNALRSRASMQTDPCMLMMAGRIHQERKIEYEKETQLEQVFS